MRSSIWYTQIKKGDIGAVVYRYEASASYEVEFVTAEGKTIAVLTEDNKQ